MGILNVTPDSFSDGGKLYAEVVPGRDRSEVNVEKAVEVALQMVSDGADIIDIGGESTGPGSKDVSLEEELARVIPVVRGLRSEMQNGLFKAKNEVKSLHVHTQTTLSGVDVNVADKRPLISVDTYKAEVARQALEAGADMINDVTALRGDPQMAGVLAKYDVPVVIMYAKDATARTTREVVHYDDIIQTVRAFLEERIAYGVASGIARDRFVIDPGMGAFVSGDPKYSLEILKRLAELQDLHLPILVGASRKGFIGSVLEERLEGSLACAAVATLNGASILRVHDVQETRRFIDMIWNIKKA